VTDVQIVEGGAYCIAVPFTPVNVQVTLAFNSPADSIGADIGGYSGCPDGYAIAVMPLDANHVATNSGFWIAIN
jgi:hypothetical protein